MYKSSESTKDDSIVESDVISLFAGLVTGNYISLLARQSHGEMGSEAHGTSLNCFIVFLIMSAGCVAIFRTCVQIYLEI